MAPTQAHFSINERKNIFAEGGKEWAFSVNTGGSTWVITAWSNKPTEKEITQLKKIVIRSFKIYHQQLRIPPFEMEEV